MGLEELNSMLSTSPGKMSAPISLLNQMSNDFRVSLHRAYKEATKHGFTFFVLGDQHPQASRFGGAYVEPNSSEFNIVIWVGHGIYEPGSSQPSYETRPATAEEVERISAEQEDLLEYAKQMKEEEGTEPIDPEHCSVCKAISEGKDPSEAMAEAARQPGALVLTENMSEEERNAAMEGHDGPVFFSNFEPLTDRLRNLGVKFLTYGVFNDILNGIDGVGRTPHQIFADITEAGIKLVVFGNELNHEDPESVHVVTNVLSDGDTVSNKMREATEEEVAEFDAEIARLESERADQ